MEGNFFQTFIRPSKAIEKIRSTDAKTTVIIYSLLGMAILLFHSHTGHLGKLIGTRDIFLFCVLGGPIMGNLSGWLSAWMFHGLSNQFFYINQETKRRDVWNAIAFANGWVIAVGALIVLEYLIYGDVIFNKRNIVEYLEGPKIYYYLMEAVKLVLLVWTLINSMLLLSRLLGITVIQALIVNFVSLLLVYGLGRIILFAIYKIMTA